MLACTRHSYVPKKPVCLSINSITCCRGFLAERGPALLDLCRGELLCMFSCSSTDCCIWRPVGTPCCPNCAYLSGCVLLGRQALRPSVFGSDDVWLGIVSTLLFPSLQFSTSCSLAGEVSKQRHT